MDSITLQNQLEQALANKDIVDFEICLDMGGDPLKPDNTNKCVFEKVLSTYGCANYVEKCLDRGCSGNYMNPFLCKSAIHFAADSGDPEIFQKLLKYPNIRVNHKFDQQTALHTLVRQISDQNIDACIQSLLSYGASPLATDGKGMTPLQYAMKNSTLSHEMKRKLISILEYYGNAILKEDYEVQNLIESIKDKDNKTFDILIENEYKEKVQVENRTPLDFAIEVGNFYALRKLLNHSNEYLKSGKNSLIKIVKHWKQENSLDYCKCFYLILNSTSIDINAADDRHFTALHYAVDNQNRVAMKELLKRKAFIGARSLCNTLAVDGIPADILQDCLDNCVTSNGFEQDDTKFEIAMHYDNLMPKLKIIQTRKFDEDLVAIKYIAKSDKHHYLLEHPVISSFLNIKWSQLAFMFYASFLLYVLFAISMCGYIVLKFCTKESQKQTTLDVFWILSWIGIAYLIIKELIQMINERFNYFRSPSNYVELTMIVMSILTCTPSLVDYSHQRVIAVTTILLISVEIFLLTGSVPIYSMTKHMLMFEAVCKSFLRSFMLYSIFFITFSLCFYILFAEAAKWNLPATSHGLNTFATPLGTFLKTIVMLTGELDSGSMEFQTIYSYILFLLYVFFMTIVLYNLLNGLAVSDIQAIEGQAEQRIIISRINLIIRYGKALTGHSEQLTFNVNLNQFQHLYKHFMDLNSNVGNVFNPKKCDIENVTLKSTFSIRDQRTIELAMDILEKRNLASQKLKYVKDSESRIINIENKLENICEFVREHEGEMRKLNKNS